MNGTNEFPTSNVPQCMDKSSQELAASLQEMTARLSEAKTDCYCALPVDIDVSELVTHKEIEAFVARSQSYRERTREVNEGTY
jgi:hypothetical protein